MEQTMVGHDSSVGIATHYGLDGERIESRRGRDFPHLSRPDLGPTQPTVQWISRFFPEGKATGAWRNHPPLSSDEVKERVEVYTYSRLGLHGLFYAELYLFIEQAMKKTFEKTF
jgi:hypothetical protein